MKEIVKMPSCDVYEYSATERKLKRVGQHTKSLFQRQDCAERLAITELIKSQPSSYLFVCSDFPCDQCHEALKEFAQAHTNLIVYIPGNKNRTSGYEVQHEGLWLNPEAISSSAAASSSTNASSSTDASSSTVTAPTTPISVATSSDASGKEAASKNAKLSKSKKQNNGKATPYSSSPSVPVKKSNCSWGGKTYANDGTKGRHDALIDYKRTKPLYHLVNHPISGVETIVSLEAFSVNTKIPREILIEAINKKITDPEKKKDKK